MMPSPSARIDIAARVCVCSAAASLFAEAASPAHGPAAAHEAASAPLAGAIGSVLMLLLLFACVWDPLRERIARGVLRTVGDPHDWLGTMLDDLFFFGGSAAGLFIAPDISPEISEVV